MVVLLITLAYADLALGDWLLALLALAAARSGWLRHVMCWHRRARLRTASGKRESESLLVTCEMYKMAGYLHIL